MSKRGTGRLLVTAGTLVLGLLLPAVLVGQDWPSARHTIFLTGLEVKGSTTAEKLAPPSVNPADLSKGYMFKGPGEADKGAPQKWEVSSYVFSPAFVTLRKGDSVLLTAFLVNGDEHEVMVTDPDGIAVIPKATWRRGREYHVPFVAEKAGAYTLMCSTHAPTMAATFFVLPK